jgi:Fur family transcriptional regulator, ferric uptake regulator
MAAMSQPADLAGQLRRRGLRMTAQRQRVLDAVRELGHATPEQVAGVVAGVDLTTVYRALELLEELGVIKHTHLGHGAPSYRLADDDHVHLVCHRCGSVTDADPAIADDLAHRLLAEHGLTLDLAHFTVFGECRECTVAREQTPAARR